MDGKKKLAIACQGGGSNTAFTAGVLKKFLEVGVDEQYNLVGLSGTSGGAVCAAATWYGLLKKAQGASEPPYERLVNFWKANSAYLPWERALNAWIIQTVKLQDQGILPTFAANPYSSEWMLELLKSIAPRKEYLDFQSLLSQSINFTEIPSLIQPDSPRLLLGAVNILSGEFKVFDSTQPGDIRVEALMASACIPSAFQAVKIGEDAYWDGLFSQNPPVGGLLQVPVEKRPEEIWIIQIDPKTRETIPMTPQDISDRRTELSGNLSLYQEARFIELVNQWIKQGFFKEEKVGLLTPINVRWIEIGDAVSQELDYASKLERDSSFIQKLMAEGEKQATQFLESLGKVPAYT